MEYTLENIHKIIRAEALQLPAPRARISHLSVDSRRTSAAPVSLFFALPGERRDGHQYLDAAFAAGVRNFVVSRNVALEKLPGANVLRVENTLRALQALAKFHRERFQIPVCGITGSNGKTVVKEWLDQCLSPFYSVVKSPRSFNSQTGVPLSVWEMNTRHQIALFEAGISQTNEMKYLADIIRPTLGILTNIGPAHREGFADDVEKTDEKMKLFDRAQTLICRLDQAVIARAAADWAAGNAERELLSWSTQNAPGARFRVEYGHPETRGFTRIRLWENERNDDFEIPFSDEASIENAVHCFIAVQYLNRLNGKEETPLQAFQMLEPVDMRLTLKAGIQNSILIDDAYSNDPASLRIALQFARQQSADKNLTVILSDLLQSGRPEKELYAEVGAMLREFRVKRLIGVGSAVRNLADEAPFTCDFFADTEAFLKEVSRFDFDDAVVLVKGARIFSFERIVRRLEQKAHKTVLEVNLDALVHNYNAYHGLLQKGVKMMVMVKAAGYGAGSAEVAKLLEFHRADYLGVAYTDEGIELRQNGVQLPILVLNPEPGDYDAMYRYRLEPEIYNFSGLKALARYTGEGLEMGVHIKLDTGMHRLGFEAGEMDDLLSILAAHPNWRVRSVFSHLSASDNASHDDFTHRQAAVFLELYKKIEKKLGYAPLRHICNTGGIERFPEYHFEMVRLGVGLYGVGGKRMEGKLRTVNTLKATVSRIKTVSAGETVGYNRNGPVAADSRIATISIGYADGFLRLAGNGRYNVAIHGRLAPTIGNICMDMCMIDVSRIPEAREGDEVIVFGDYPDVHALAACLQTIPYEIFTNIADRVKRVYWKESG